MANSDVCFCAVIFASSAINIACSCCGYTILSVAYVLLVLYSDSVFSLLSIWLYVTSIAK